jgi:hypothetical protein
MLLTSSSLSTERIDDNKAGPATAAIGFRRGYECR